MSRNFRNEMPNTHFGHNVISSDNRVTRDVTSSDKCVIQSLERPEHLEECTERLQSLYNEVFVSTKIPLNKQELLLTINDLLSMEESKPQGGKGSASGGSSSEGENKECTWDNVKKILKTIRDELLKCLNKLADHLPLLKALFNLALLFIPQLNVLKGIKSVIPLLTIINNVMNKNDSVNIKVIGTELLRAVKPDVSPIIEMASSYNDSNYSLFFKLVAKLMFNIIAYVFGLILPELMKVAFDVVEDYTRNGTPESEKIIKFLILFFVAAIKQHK